MSTSNISSRAVSTKQSGVSGPKPTTFRKHLSVEKNANVTIRLSGLDIKKRTPSQCHLQIQDSRVDHILDATIRKLQIAVSLPRLLRRDACLLRQFFTERKEVDYIVAICNKYLDLPILEHITPQSSAMYSSIANIGKHHGKSNSSKYFSILKLSLADPQMAAVIEMLWNNQRLRGMILEEFSSIPQNQSTILVNCIRDLRKIVKCRLSVSASQERLREKQLRTACSEIDRIKKNIQKTQELLEKQRDDNAKMLQDTRITVMQYENRVNDLNKKFLQDIKHITMDSEREMGIDFSTSQQQQENLAVEAKTITHQYESLLTQHMHTERALRAKRFKIESQLCSWLGKFDSDIGDRQTEFDEVNTGYEGEKARMEEIQDHMNKQNPEYVLLMAQKEDEEQEFWNTVAYEYLKNRSARRIQRCWRAYRQRKIDRKNAKKAKALEKKRKAEEKAARKEAGEEEPKAKKDNKDKKGKDKKKQVPPSADSQGAELVGDLDEEEFSKIDDVDLEADFDD